jgi:hypothetical protein
MKNAIRPALLSLTLALLALLAAGSGAANAVVYQKESLSAYEGQLTSGQIKEATINKRVRSIRLTLKDGRYAVAKYAPHEEPKVLFELKRRHIPYSVLSPEAAKARAAKAPVHHKLRYIVGGVVIAIIIIVAGIVFYRRRGVD